MYNRIALLNVQDEVIGSGYVTALTIQQKFKYTGKAYVLGSASLAEELSKVGIIAVGIGVSKLPMLMLGSALVLSLLTAWHVFVLKMEQPSCQSAGLSNVQPLNTLSAASSELD